jgi:uncharacterized protein (TIGR00251 family)
MHGEGITLSLRVQPGASANGIGAVRGQELVVKVTAPPVDSKANEAVLDLLCERLGVNWSALELLRGHANRSKVILVRGGSPELVPRLYSVGSDKNNG